MPPYGPGAITISSWIHDGFTTCNHTQHPKIQLSKLNDHQLGVHKVSSRTTHKVQVVQPPNSTLANSQHGRSPLPETTWEVFLSGFDAQKPDLRDANNAPPFYDKINILFNPSDSFNHCRRALKFV